VLSAVSSCAPSTERPAPWSEAAGLGERFVHGLGHGVGLEIHEAPMLGSSATGILSAGTPVTVEPGVYLPGRGESASRTSLVVRDGVPDLLTQLAETAARPRLAPTLAAGDLHVPARRRRTPWPNQ